MLKRFDSKTHNPDKIPSLPQKEWSNTNIREFFFFMRS